MTAFYKFLALGASVVFVLQINIRAADETAQERPSICNPLDLDYRFELSGQSFREAADPTAIYFHGEYWIFASKTGGYWHSPDFVHWNLVEPTGLPLEAWAPTVVAIKDRLYFATTDSGIYTTDDPSKGHWVLVSKDLNVGHDADLFLDDDGRLYLYSGCSNKDPIWGQQLDIAHDFTPIGPRVNLVFPDLLHRGWEARRSTIEPDDLASDTAHPKAPWIEGSWMNKAEGRYCLQYAAPGTECDTYGDGVFVSDHPLGPFVYQPYSPFSLKPTGFARGAGHSSTFQDAKGNYWHIVTITISKRDMFERRLGVYPVRFFPDGQMACNTYLGDYPQYPPGVADDPFDSNSPGWMLLSLNKPVTASSELPGFPADNAVDENLHDWWSAVTGNPGEWLQVDLGKMCRISAVQLNFADQDSRQFGRLRHDAYRYRVDASDDATHWTTMLDRKDNTRDAPHEYVQLAAAQTARYVRITNLHTPARARFSMSGLRIFGNSPGPAPAAPTNVVASRNPKDDRSLQATWATAPGADFYVVRYGIRADRLYSNFQVYNATNVEINLLNSGVNYFVTVDAINGSGITAGTNVVSVPSTTR
jgi:xylan 1,4-beta-xylosidase